MSEEVFFFGDHVESITKQRGKNLPKFDPVIECHRLLAKFAATNNSFLEEHVRPALVHGPGFETQTL